MYRYVCVQCIAISQIHKLKHLEMSDRHFTDDSRAKDHSVSDTASWQSQQKGNRRKKADMYIHI